MHHTLRRLDRLLGNELDYAARFCSSKCELSCPPDYSCIKYLPDQVNEDGRKCGIIIANGIRYETWFQSKPTALRFLDALWSHLKPGTTPQAFANLVAAFMCLQSSRLSAGEAVTLRGVSECIADLDGLMGSICGYFLDDESWEPGQVETTRKGSFTFFQKINAWLVWDRTTATVFYMMAHDERPVLTMIGCSLFYGHGNANRLTFFGPCEEDKLGWVRHAHHSYSPNRNLAAIQAKIDRVARLFKPGTDSVIVGLFLDQVFKLQYYGIDGGWLMDEEHHADCAEDAFFQGLIEAVEPCSQVVLLKSSPGSYEFEASRYYYDCDLSKDTISIVIHRTSQEDDSDADTEDEEEP